MKDWETFQEYLDRIYPGYNEEPEPDPEPDDYDGSDIGSATVDEMRLENGDY